ncbi:hypothetical protein AB0H71_33720 [Nocardia sp. NPDC050697]|uniref:hypothetical protein n=1 Tax=Nocardia sp. NPDC050697 TaxID=3155158 RepID=UPI0033FB4353
MITPPHRKMRRNPLAWYEQLYREQCKGHSRLRIGVEHAIAHLKNWRSLSRHLPRRALFEHNILAAAGLLSDFQHVSRPPSVRRARAPTRPALASSATMPRRFALDRRVAARGRRSPVAGRSWTLGVREPSAAGGLLLAHELDDAPARGGVRDLEVGGGPGDR